MGARTLRAQIASLERRLDAALDGWFATLEHVADLEQRARLVGKIRVLRHPRVDPRIARIYVHRSGEVDVLDHDGDQIQDLRGNAAREPGLLGRLRDACPDDAEWIGPRPP